MIYVSRECGGEVFEFDSYGEAIGFVERDVKFCDAYMSDDAVKVYTDKDDVAYVINGEGLWNEMQAYYRGEWR